MPLIQLYLGEECTRFPTEQDAKNAGVLGHTVSKPARIEVTPDGGGPITTFEYDPLTSAWTASHN